MPDSRSSLNIMIMPSDMIMGFLYFNIISDSMIKGFVYDEEKNTMNEKGSDHIFSIYECDDIKIQPKSPTDFPHIL